jgi:hypothetical protein
VKASNFRFGIVSDATGIWYRGMADLHDPGRDGFGYAGGFTCEHRHATPDEAKTCARTSAPVAP